MMTSSLLLPIQKAGRKNFRKPGEETRTSDHHDSPCNLIAWDPFLRGLLRVYDNPARAAAFPAVRYVL